MRSFAAFAIIMLTASAAAAQTPLDEQKHQAETRAREGVGYATFLIRERVPLEKTIKGAPYSAEVLIESNQALADGNRINQRSTGRVYRDSEGRTRREEDRANGTVEISIVDPVAGMSYSLDPETRTAWKTPTEAAEEIMKKLEAKRKAERMKVEDEARRASGEPAESRANAEAGGGKREAEIEAKRKREAELEAARISSGRLERRGPAAEEHKEGPLERKMLEGIAVEGRRSTTTIRAGAIGNDLPINITSEEWSSPDLKVLVMTRHTDPRSGDNSYKLTNIVRAEPDRSLFQVPPDYTIKETGIRKFEEERERR